MLLVGLTGGIGSGKSAVAERLVAHGAHLIDADAIAREVVAPGTVGLNAVLENLGVGLRAPDGSLDREAVARLVFENPDKRAVLNAIVHPLVRRRTGELVLAAAEADPGGIVVNDVPLLVEAGLSSSYDEVVVVLADEQTRLDRLTGQRGMTEADARARIAAQATDDERLAVATHVVRNDGSLADLDEAVDRLWQALRRRADGQTS